MEAGTYFLMEKKRATPRTHKISTRITKNRQYACMIATFMHDVQGGTVILEMQACFYMEKSPQRHKHTQISTPK
jgi:hypothetical protein